MISYRDMTFCEAKDCQRFDGCPLALTPKVQQEARKWWGGEDAPIAIFSAPPRCFVPSSETRNDPDQ